MPDPDADTAVVWFRRDLRLHDNEPLVEAAGADRLLPVYAFDPREFGRRPYGGRRSFEYTKTGAHRARFLVESVADLRGSLRARGSELLVRRGRPERVLPGLAARVGADRVYFETRPTTEERDVEDRLGRALREGPPVGDGSVGDGTDGGSAGAGDGGSAGDDGGDGPVLPQRYWGHTLYHADDLPTSPYDIDDTYTPFRRAVEDAGTVRDTLAVPDLPPLPDPVVAGEGDDTPVGPAADGGGPRGAADDPGVPAGAIPEVPDLDPELQRLAPDDRGVLDFEGGESAGLARLEEYVWEEDRLRRYKETRNGLLGADYSSKFSAWLNLGCLSPRRVHEAVEEYETERVANDSTYWLVFELLWRDFFQFQFLKHRGTHFTREGIRDRTDVEWSEDGAEFRRWARGETGIPFVDANVRELNRTGYVSNRGRQNAASFLANDLRHDWRRGAAYFETQLVDYDPASNYGNWAYVAGVGNDSRDRSFDVLSQARRYDGDAEYVTHWLPELDGLPPEYAHEPWTMGPGERAAHGVELGVDYPRPMVDPERLQGNPD